MAAATALAGCELLKHNEEALAIINQRVVGMPAGQFFDRYGRGEVRGERPDGTTEYTWTSALPVTRPGPEGPDDRTCRLAVSVDRRGRVSGVTVLFDAPGLASTSRCGEIFAKG